MPLSNADNPTAVLAVEPVAEPPTAVPVSEPAPSKKVKAAAVKAEEPAAPELARAFTSGNAEVHNLVARREIAASNEDADAVAAVDAELAALGYRI